MDSAAAIADPTLVLQAVAATLEVREERQRLLLATLAERLEAARLLLVLDNCEHVVAACAEVAAALLRGCPAQKSNRRKPGATYRKFLFTPSTTRFTSSISSRFFRCSFRRCEARAKNDCEVCGFDRNSMRWESPQYSFYPASSLAVKTPIHYSSAD